MEYYSLFKTYLKQFKDLGGGQYTALCPFHDDKNPSLSVDVPNGLWNCFACGNKGNAYQFAEKMNLDKPHQYIEDDFTHTTDIKPKQIDETFTDYTQKMYRMQQTLMENKALIPIGWNNEDYMIEEYNLGADMSFCKKDNKKKMFLVIGYCKDGIVVGGKYHGGRKTFGYAKKQWFPNKPLRDDMPLYICEGEKDALCLISNGFQAISSTGGAMSIPNLDILKGFTNKIFICYDNDETGRKGQLKLANQIKKAYPNLKVNLIVWSKELPNKYDVSDAFDELFNS